MLKIQIASFPILLAIFVLLLGQSFVGPENYLYFNYTASLVDDGDLNLTDQLYPIMGGIFPVTTTYNFPDFHNHGGVIIWAPFYAVGRLLNNLFGFSLLPMADFLMTLSTAICGLWVMAITFFIVTSFFGSSISKITTVLMLFGTPFFYYCFIEAGNANIVSALFSAYSILFLYQNQKLSSWILYGLFFSICVTVKVDIWFQIIFISLILIKNFLESRAAFLKLAFFIMGFLPALFLKSINDYLKYGQLHFGEFGMVNLRGFYLWEQLFSSYRGILYSSPILFFCFIGWVCLMKRFFKDPRAPFKDYFMFALGIYFICKILIISFRYAWGGGTFGGRILISEFPVMAMLYAYLINLSSTRIRWGLLGLSFVFVLWNFLIGMEFFILSDEESYLPVYKNLPLILERINVLIMATSREDLYRWVGIGTLIGFAFWFRKQLGIIVKFWQNFLCGNSFVRFFCYYSVIAYFVITACNFTFNKKNALLMQGYGRYFRAKMTSIKAFENVENVESLTQMIDYFSSKGDTSKVAKLKLHLQGLQNNRS